MKDLSIIILNWNTREDLRRCLKSLEAEIVAPSAVQGAVASVRASVGTAPHPALDTEVIVVDNASSDGSPQMVQECFPWVRLIANPENVGFSAGNNIGLKEGTGRYLMLLNPDTVVHTGALERLVAFADAHPDAGITASKLLNADGTLQPSCRNFPTLAHGFFRNTPLGKLFPQNRFNRNYLMEDWDHSTPREVDWVTGAVMLIRREALDDIEGLDEGFFMYCEDIDLCYRAKLKGWKTVYCPDSVITHLQARASTQAVTRMLIQHHKSIYRFFRKHYAATTNPLLWPLIIGGLVARCGGFIVKNRIDRFRQARQSRRRNRQEGIPPS